jgi:hypothetical protein
MSLRFDLTPTFALPLEGGERGAMQPGASRTSLIGRVSHA